MNYIHYKVEDEEFWRADPENWEELAYTLNEEDTFLDWNPNGEGRPDLVHMFD